MSIKLAIPSDRDTFSKFSPFHQSQYTDKVFAYSSEDDSDDIPTRRAYTAASPTCSSVSSCSTAALQRNETPPRQPTKTLFVGNLAVEVTETMLHELFSQFGLVVECCKRWYHYAFIQYSTEYEAQQALQSLDGHRIQGRAMRVEFQRKKLKAILRSSDETFLQSNVPTSSTPVVQCITPGSSQRAIYISVVQTDSYFTRPGEQVMPCVDYKTYELFPLSSKDDQSEYQQNNRFAMKQLSSELFPALECASRKFVDSEVSSNRRRYVQALRLLQH